MVGQVNGVWVAIVLALIGLVCIACYCAYQWRESERKRIAQEAVIAELLTRSSSRDAEAPPNGRPPRTIRIARDGAAGLAWVAVVAGMWIGHLAPGKVAIAGVLLAASTSLLLLVVPSENPPIHVHRRQGVHATRKPWASTRSQPSSVSQTYAPSAMAIGSAPPSPLDAGFVMSTNPMPVVTVPSTSMLSSATAIPSTSTVPPTTATATTVSRCVIEIDLLQLVEVCVE